MRIPPRTRIVNDDGTMSAEFFRAFDALCRSAESSPVTHFGIGDPNGVVNGNISDLYINESGGANVTLWVKESGAGTNTGWVAK